jgi:hypothetical protein
MAILTLDAVDARLSTQARIRLFAKNGGAVVDVAFEQLCVDDTNSLIATWTAAAFPQGFELPGGVVDKIIVRKAFAACCGLAASAHTSADPALGAYAKGLADAEKYFRALTRDDNARPVTSAAGRALPSAELQGTTDDAGAATRIYGDLADGQSRSSF